MEVVAVDDVPETGEQFLEAAPVLGKVGDDREEPPRPVRKDERGDFPEVPGPGLVAGLDIARPFGEPGPAEKIRAEARPGLDPGQDVAFIERGAERPGVRILELGRLRSEPGLEEALVEDEAGETELLGDVGLVLVDGPANIGLADEEEIAVLLPAPGDRLPIIRVAAEMALIFDRRLRGPPSGRRLA